MRPLPQPMTLSVVTLLVTTAGKVVLLAQGGPPLMTDDPGTPGNGKWEVNLACTAEKRDGGHVFEAPILDINYGVGERVQLKFELPWVFVHPEDDETKNGLGNSLIGVKWRFLDQATHALDVSVYPQAEFSNPTSSAERGIVEGGTSWIMPVQLERSFGDFSVNPEIGIALLEEEDEWLYGLAVGYSPISKIEVLAELHGSAELDFGDDELLAQVGCRWAVHPNLTLLGAVGRGIRHPKDGDIELVAYFGVQFLFGMGSQEDRS